MKLAVGDVVAARLPDALLLLYIQSSLSFCLVVVVLPLLHQLSWPKPFSPAPIPIRGQVFPSATTGRPGFTLLGGTAARRAAAARGQGWGGGGREAAAGSLGRTVPWGHRERSRRFRPAPRGRRERRRTVPEGSDHPPGAPGTPRNGFPPGGGRQMASDR